MFLYGTVNDKAASAKWGAEKTTRTSSSIRAQTRNKIHNLFTIVTVPYVDVLRRHTLTQYSPRKYEWAAKAFVKHLIATICL